MPECRRQLFRGSQKRGHNIVFAVHVGYGSAQARRSALTGAGLHARPQAPWRCIVFEVVCHFLRLRWSSEQIALTLAHIFPKGHEHRVSHETIYNCVYARPVVELRKELIAYMRQAHNKRVPRSKGQDH